MRAPRRLDLVVVPPRGEVRELPGAGPARDAVLKAAEDGLVVILRGGPGRYVYRRRGWMTGKRDEAEELKAEIERRTGKGTL